MTTFADHFWGEKNNGFYVLYHNMKHGQTASKEFIDFLRESCSAEENYSKLLNKLARTASNSPQVGTFAPFWNVLKVLAEKLATLHMQLVHTWTDLIKDVSRYNDEQHKRHKSMKENEAGTLETVNAIQQTTTALHKAKELYHTRCLELERLKRDNATQKELEKAESKYKKANDDYKSLVDKYANVRNDFETKMLGSCKNFQELQEEHICQMKDFIDTYAKAWENEHALIGQVHNEFKASCDELSVQKCLETFITSKTTGAEKPGPMEFVEPDLSSLPPPRPTSPEPGDKRDSITGQRQDSNKISMPNSSGSPSPVLSDQPGPLSRSVKLRVSRTWFLNKNKKKKKKKAKDKDGKDDKADTESVDTQEGTTPEVDDDGYQIRPEDPLENNGDKNSWYSSDSDTDSDEESRRKIKVEIRPKSPNNAATGSNVQEIMQSVQGLRLSPTVKRRSQTPTDKKMKRSQSESDTLDSLKPSQDLLKLDFFGSSSASTPTGGGYNLPSPLSPMADSSVQNSVTNSAVTTPIANQSNISILNSSNDMSKLSNALPSPSSQLTPTQGTSIGVPSLPQRPPSRNKSIVPQVPARSSGRNSPAPGFMSRSESSGSVTFNTTSMHGGTSRGPSPLTIGMSDTIPLAIAFTETINAYFKGTDATQCAVKITGNIMMSFPAGVVRVFTENPSPATLSFTIKNATQLEHVLLNKQLITQDSELGSSDNLVYSFDMSALSDHLRSQGEQNKSASYFNIDILKYQVKPHPGVESTPVPLVVYWKCDENITDYRLDYKYNPSSLSHPSVLKNITATVVVNGGVTNMQSIPSGNWNEESQRATWKLNDLAELSEDGSQGCIRAKFNLKSGPSKPATTAIAFISEGASLSGVDFELVGSGYRISLLKKRFGAGKYLADPDSMQRQSAV